MRTAGGVTGWYAERRFTILFATLLLTISGHALAGRLLPVANPLDWILGLSLVALVLSVRGGRLRWVLYAATVGIVGARLAQLLFDHAAPAMISNSLHGVACLLAGGVAIFHAVSPGPVDRERIFAALDAYILFGIAFGLGYWMLETVLPGSLSVAGGLTPQRAIYFSFVTQATLGYGDILPITADAQGLVTAQAVGGQMYLAVLVARLVSLFSAQWDR